MLTEFGTEALLLQFWWMSSGSNIGSKKKSNCMRDNPLTILYTLIKSALTLHS